jgi:hypothetical protein
MMLTLEQVKEAGRFAFQLTGGDEVPIWNPCTRELAEIIPWSGIETYGFRSMYRAEPSVVHGPGAIVTRESPDSDSGWHHLPGCDCQFCKEDE